MKAVNKPFVPINPVKKPPSFAGLAAISKKPTIAASMVDMKLIWFVLGNDRFIESVKALAVVPATNKPKIPIE